MSLGIPDPGRLGARHIDGAARAADRRQGSLVHGAADPDLLVNARMFARRLARSFGSGGVWLAGDAAHQAAPVGVHSMNSGLVEARELAARMSIQHIGGRRRCSRGSQPRRTRRGSGSSATVTRCARFPRRTRGFNRGGREFSTAFQPQARTSNRSRTNRPHGCAARTRRRPPRCGDTRRSFTETRQ